jgi:hypothetical protein
MGKKPVLGLMGALWVGLALTGCTQTRSQWGGDAAYKTPSTFGSLTAPPAGRDAAAAPTASAQGWNTRADGAPIAKPTPPADAGGFNRSPYGPSGMQQTGMQLPPPPPPPASPAGMDGGRMGMGRDGNPPTMVDQTSKFPPAGQGMVVPPPPPSTASHVTTVPAPAPALDPVPSDPAPAAPPADAPAVEDPAPYVPMQQPIGPPPGPPNP